MNERDRMLAEGPRVAPEPPTADGSAPTPAKPSRPSPSPAQAGTPKVPRGLMRVFPLVLFGVVLAANAGAGKYAFWVIVPIAVGAIVIRLVRKGRK